MKSQMKNMFLFILLLLFACGDGQQAPEPKVPPEYGSISGEVFVPKPPLSLIYIALGRNYDELTLGRPVKLAVMRTPGQFRFTRVEPGSYYLGAYVDINGNRVPNIPMEPYFLTPTAISLSAGEKVENISVKGFFNERNPAFKTAEIIKEYEKLIGEAKSLVGNAYQKLKAGEDDLLFSVMPSLRAMVYEAEATWLTAGNGSDWEHVKLLLEPIPAIASGAIRGENLLGTQRGCFLRAYVSAVDKTVQRYAVFVPEAYDGSRAFPLVIALHGAGADHWGGMKMVSGSGALAVGAEKSNEQFFPRNLPPDFIVACPNGHGYNGPGYRESAEYDVMKVIKTLVSDYNIDANRIYLTGSSKGGRGTWEIGLKYPEMFAAIAPICGATDLARTLAANAARVRVFAFHGAKDQFIPVTESRAMAAAVYQSGLPVQYEYTEEPEMGHEAAILLYKGGMIFDLFRKS